jgi:hypothetical protein
MPDLHTGLILENRKVLVRRKNAEYRQREYLSETEGKAVMAAVIVFPTMSWTCLPFDQLK